MDNFKLLAIRPLKHCGRKFIKNLSAGHIYPLYNSYSFFNESNEEVKTTGEVDFIKKVLHTPSDLYDIETAGGENLRINISAIAGRNGSGKSTLIDFFFAAVYLFSVNEEILYPNPSSLESRKIDLHTESEILKSNVSKMLKEKKKLLNSLKEMKSYDNEAFLNIKELFDTYTDEVAALQKQKEFINKSRKGVAQTSKSIAEFRKRFKGEIYYEMNGGYSCLHLDYDKNTNRHISEIRPVRCFEDMGRELPDAYKTERDPALICRHFFYTIAINYSHYALNSDHLGEWIKTIFHKNDGYTTPLVVNPMRTTGNFMINSEMNFARYRLLTNILNDYINKDDFSKKVYVTDHQFVKSIIFTLNRTKVSKIPKAFKLKGPEIVATDLRALNLLNSLLADYLTTAETMRLNTTEFYFKEIIINYIVQKIDKITTLYPWFGSGYQFGKSTPFFENEKLFKSIKQDTSHITYKLKQAINFLKFNINRKDSSEFYVEKKMHYNRAKIEFEFSLEDLIKWMGNPRNVNISSFLPPSIFDIEFKLSGENGSESFFNDLSSGEQQMIHTIQSVVYHFNNLQSTHTGKSHPAKYEYVNIIYDEIELYFHPDYQRRFIADLLQALGRIHMDKNKRIKALNILFLTHSPFILSDIPKENIMLLDRDSRTGRSIQSPPESQTFAANINDLLADGFFLKGTLIGSFAEKQIKDVIGKVKRKEVITERDSMVIKMVGDSFLKSSLQNFLNNSE